VLAWLERDRLIAALDHDIDAIADDGAALSDDDRAARLADLAGRALDLERREEELICLAANDGIVIHRRPAADPRAVLGLAGDLPAPA
jgi:hypothetical protein